MEETSVARSQSPHEIVHRQFEGFRIFGRKDVVLPGLRQRGPHGAVKLRIEVVLRNLPVNLIEDVCALLVAQLFWSL